MWFDLISLVTIGATQTPDLLDFVLLGIPIVCFLSGEGRVERIITGVCLWLSVGLHALPMIFLAVLNIMNVYI